MALKSTIYKAELQIADMDRHYYADHSLTIALHPSETAERMMVRVAAFALFAQERLEFCKGLSDMDEPDLWEKDLTGAIETWIDVGQPDERRIAKASGRAKNVVVMAYGGRTSDIWWQGVRNKVERLRNVTVWSLGDDVADALGALAQRTMRLQCTVQDGAAWLGSADSDAVPIEWTVLKVAPDANPVMHGVK
ncbi:YaeQ family protein [Paraburkholderia humisilvae]|nr:YaeQ family protein [Paraburkholderia humisilvae]